MNPAADLLLVEDNPADLELALRAIRRAGAVYAGDVRVARDGAEALACFFGAEAEWGGANGRLPRAIFLDLKLPKIDGFGVLQQLKSDPRTRAVPVVALTSSREARDIAECYRLGANSYVVKPMESEDFAAAVGSLRDYWLGRNEPPQAPAQP